MSQKSLSARFLGNYLTNFDQTRQTNIMANARCVITKCKTLRSREARGGFGGIILTPLESSLFSTSVNKDNYRPV